MTTFDWPTTLDLPGYRPVTRPHAKQVREAARLIVEAKRPVLYVGGGVISAPAPAGAARARRADRDPGRHDADGARRLPRQPPAAPRHARHARHRRRGHRAAEERPARHARRALRRPRDRQARHLRARRRRSSTPTSTRPRSPRTARPTCRSSATAREVIADLIVAAAGRAGRRPRGRLRGLVAAPRPAAARRTRSATPTSRRRLAVAAVRHRAARRDRRPGRDLHRGRRPAPDVGRAVHQVREARAPGSTPAASARWATPCRPRWAPRSAARTRRSGRSTATAASR